MHPSELPDSQVRVLAPRRFRERAGVLLAILLGGLLLLLGDAGTAQAAPPPFHPERILLKPRREKLADLQRFHQTQSLRDVQELIHLDGLQIVSFPAGRVIPGLVRRYVASGLVEFAEPDLRLELAAAPNDPRYADGSLWHLHNYGQNSGKVDADIDAPEAWDILSTASNVVVAIVDSGANLTHNDLAPNLWINAGEIAGNGLDDDNDGYTDNVHGINTTAKSSPPVDLIGHGTQVAGFIGAVGNNGSGAVGLAWRTQLMICRFVDAAGNVYLSQAALAMDWARARGAQIINASFINTLYSGTLYSAITTCRNAGIIIVAAAGNAGVNNDNTPYYPASYDLDNIVAVAATTRNDLLASFSNYGASSVDLGAPGADVYSTFNSGNDSYAVNSGTSFASPIVAGSLALLRAQYPTASYQQLIQHLLTSTDPLPSLAGKCVSGGRLNIARALDPSVTSRFAATPGTGSAPLTVRFTNTMTGIPTGWLWEFGDGTTSTQPHPTHQYTSVGTYTASLTVTGRLGNVSTTNRVITVIPNYLRTNTTFAWIEPGSMASVGVTGDGVSNPQALPFPFHFYGQPYQTIYVGANGVLSFDSQGLPASNTDLPTAAVPNNLICPFWDDLAPTVTGVRFGITGVSPARRAVASWLHVPAGGGPSVAHSFQVILEEDSNDVVFQYLEVNPESRNASAAGRTASIGLEHRSGLAAARYSFNGSSLLTNGQAIRFVPVPTPTVTNLPPLAVTLINPEWQDGRFTLSFTSQVGRSYSLLASDQFEGTNWITLGSIPGNGAILTMTNALPAAPYQFHRIEAR